MLGRTADDYRVDDDLRDIVERNPLKIGELVMRLREHDEPTAQRLVGFHGVIGLRNVLSHDYESISDLRVWSTVPEFLPLLIPDAERILRAGPTDSSNH